MALFPEKLYSLLSADRGKFPLQPLIRTVQVDLANANVEAPFTVDFDGRVLILQAVSAFAGSGAAQTINWTRLQLKSPAGDTAPVTTYLKSLTNWPAATYTLAGIDWQGSIIIPPLWRLSASSNFSGGVAANTSVLSFQGVLIPRGTFSI